MQQGQQTPAAMQQQQQPQSQADKLAKLWQSVREKPEEFATWEQLIRESEQTNDIKQIRQAYESLLDKFPLCFGYWNKWANAEGRLGDSNAKRATFERGVKATPHSPELWLAYCNWELEAMEKSDADIRALFERAVDAVGIDYRADDLWTKYIEFETTKGNAPAVSAIFYRIIGIPNQKLEDFYTRFKTFASSQRWQDLIVSDDPLDVELSNDTSKPDTTKHATILSNREKRFQNTWQFKAARDPFESVIQRTYFHVLPQTEAELKTWHSYLDYEEKETSKDNANLGRAKKLYERCLVACAQYPEFWVRYADFCIAAMGDLNAARVVLARADRFTKPDATLCLKRGEVEEFDNNMDTASDHYSKALQISPGLIEATLALVNFERRRNAAGPDHVYKTSIEALGAKLDDAEAKSSYIYLSQHYARYFALVKGDVGAARATYKEALSKVEDDASLWLSAIAFESSQQGGVAAAADLFQLALSNKAVSDDDKQMLYQQYIDFLEDRSPSAQAILTARQKFANQFANHSAGATNSNKRKLDKASESKNDKSAKSSYGQYAGQQASQPAANGYNQQGFYGNYNYGNYGAYPQSYGTGGYGY